MLTVITVHSTETAALPTVVQQSDYSSAVHEHHFFWFKDLHLLSVISLSVTTVTQTHSHTHIHIHIFTFPRGINHHHSSYREPRKSYHADNTVVTTLPPSLRFHNCVLSYLVYLLLSQRLCSKALRRPNHQHQHPLPLPQISTRCQQLL
jgi:hypothetical protein